MARNWALDTPEKFENFLKREMEQYNSTPKNWRYAFLLDTKPDNLPDRVKTFNVIRYQDRWILLINQKHYIKEWLRDRNIIMELHNPQKALPSRVYTNLTLSKLNANWPKESNYYDAEIEIVKEFMEKWGVEYNERTLISKPT